MRFINIKSWLVTNATELTIGVVEVGRTGVLVLYQTLLVAVSFVVQMI